MGNTSGVLTEVSRKRVNNRIVVLVSCSCGKVREKRSDALTSCKWTCTHCPFTESLRNLRSYRSWDSMKQRCTNPNNARWKNYGERGITYAEDWETFEGFYKDMGERPIGLSLERVDVNGNYCKENCVWATPQQQVRNQTRRCTNTSKRTGVRWVKEKKLWLANITINYKAVFLGYFKSFEAACESRQAAELLYFGFTKE